MNVETRLTGLTNLPAKAKHAQALGYQGVATQETDHDPFFPLLLAAEHAPNLTLTSSVAIAFPRSPMITAQLSYDLQRFSNGRFRLGIGPQVKGHNQRRFSIPWSAPAPRLREYVGALRAIWDCWDTGDPLNFQGDHYTFTLMTPFFRPDPINHPHIPIYLSAVGPVMCRLAGEIADGLRLHSLCSKKYLADVMLPNIEAGARAAGRSLADVDLVASARLLVATDDNSLRQGKAELARLIAFYGSTRVYQHVLDVHGWGDVQRQLHDLSLEDRWDHMPNLITDEMIETFAIVGPPDAIAPQLLDRFALCSTVLTSIPDGSDPGDTPQHEANARTILAALTA